MASDSSSFQNTKIVIRKRVYTVDHHICADYLPDPQRLSSISKQRSHPIKYRNKVHFTQPAWLQRGGHQFTCRWRQHPPKEQHTRPNRQFRGDGSSGGLSVPRAQAVKARSFHEFWTCFLSKHTSPPGRSRGEHLEGKSGALGTGVLVAWGLRQHKADREQLPEMPCTRE